MAEPLSITASILAILGAAEKTGKGLERLRTLHNAPDELQYVLNEVSLQHHSFTLTKLMHARLTTCA